MNIAGSKCFPTNFFSHSHLLTNGGVLECEMKLVDLTVQSDLLNWQGWRRLEPLALDDVGRCKRPLIFSTQSPFGRHTHNALGAEDYEVRGKTTPN